MENRLDIFDVLLIRHLDSPDCVLRQSARHAAWLAARWSIQLAAPNRHTDAPF